MAKIAALASRVSPSAIDRFMAFPLRVYGSSRASGCLPTLGMYRRQDRSTMVRQILIRGGVASVVDAVASVVEAELPAPVVVDEAVSVALPCPDWDELELVGASMMTVRVEVAVRPDWSVATY